MGDFNQGVVTSMFFESSNYEIYTLGSTYNLNENLPSNYILTPNGDGINHMLVLELIQQFPKNTLSIFNRWVALVFEQQNYSGEFRGISNKKLIGKSDKLQSVIYFYTLVIPDLKTEYQGCFFPVNH